jgi:molecular chaperone GrpE
MNDSDIRPQDDATPAPDQTDPPAAAPGDQAAAVVQEIGRENAELRDRLLRTLAEMENLRKRTEREVADARTYGISAFARDILGVADNMHRALEALDAELRENANDSVKALLDGVELTERALMNALEKNGVKRFEPVGQKFDPNRHQAMFEKEDPSVPSGTIVQVMQAGYSIGDRVLRPAMVAISKGGPKATPTSAGGGPKAVPSDQDAPAESPANDNPTAK